MDNSAENTIDLKALFLTILKHIKFIILVTLIGAIGALTLTKFFITEKYTSTAQIYVDPRSNTTSESQLSYNDLTAAEKLVNTCQILFTGDRMAECVIEDLDNKYGKEGFTIPEIKSMITVEAATTGTSVMNIKVTSTDGELSAIIANIIRERAAEVYKEIVEGGVVKTVNEAMVPTQPSSPNLLKNTLIGFALGLFLSCAVVIIAELVDTKIKPTDDLMQMYGIPLFAEIMDFETNVKGGYDYEYKQ